MKVRSAAAAFVTATFAAAVASCRGRQSALHPLGPEAERIAVLSWVLFIGAVIIMAAVVALLAVAMFGGSRWRAWLSREVAVVAGGIIFPVVALTALLAYGLLVMRAGGAVAEDRDALRISVIGEQWWWRVVYTDGEGSRFESANEIRIPTDRKVKLALTTADVIHSLWVPNLAGKLDMIPGRTNVLTVEAEEPGVSRGQCAEYCGGAHALMALNVIALPPDEFERWLAKEAGPAEPPEGSTEEQGRLLFLSSGCGGCHAVRGTEATGTIGPDLTHVGSRLSLAAATLPNSTEAVAAWIVDNQHIKPENRMPPFGIFAEGELTAISAYLAGLR
jgi:cytochrome c oxidase subunit 2